MPRSKHGPALFEVFGKADVAGNGGPTEGPPEKPVKRGRSHAASAFRATVASLARVLGGDSGNADDDLDRTPADTRPALTIEQGRLHLALTSRGAGVAVFALLLVCCIALATGHWIGRQSGLADGRKQGRDSVETESRDAVARARDSQPAPRLFDGVGESPVRLTAVPQQRPQQAPARPAPVTESSAAASVGWVKGYTYIVVQNFRGDAQQDAERAQEYLSQRGIESAVVRNPQRGFKLVATQGFDWSDPAQKKAADRYLEKIRNIGKTYFASGGRYELKGYFQTLTSDNW